MTRLKRFLRDGDSGLLIAGMLLVGVGLAMLIAILWAGAVEL